MKKTCLALLVRNLSKSSSCANFGSLWNTVLSHDYISKCYFSTSALSQLLHSYFTSFTFPENRTIPWKVDLQWKVNYLLFLASLFPFIMFIRILNYYIYCFFFFLIHLFHQKSTMERNDVTQVHSCLTNT